MYFQCLEPILEIISTQVKSPLLSILGISGRKKKNMCHGTNDTLTICLAKSNPSLAFLYLALCVGHYLAKQKSNASGRI